MAPRVPSGERLVGHLIHPYSNIPISIFQFSISRLIQLSGLEEALEYYEIEEKFSRQKPKDGIT